MRVFPLWTNEYLLGLKASSSGFQTCDVSPLYRIPQRKNRDESQSGVCPGDECRWRMGPTKHSVNIWGVFTPAGWPFLFPYSLQPVWAFLAGLGHSWSERASEGWLLPHPDPFRLSEQFVIKRVSLRRGWRKREREEKGKRRGGGRGGMKPALTSVCRFRYSWTCLKLCHLQAPRR